MLSAKKGARQRACGKFAAALHLVQTENSVVHCVDVARPIAASACTLARKARRLSVEADAIDVMCWIDATNAVTGVAAHSKVFYAACASTEVDSEVADILRTSVTLESYSALLC